MREPGVRRLAGVALLDHELLGKGPGDGGEGVRLGHGRLCGVDGRGAAPGARAALRRSHGGAAVVGRRGREGVCVRHEVLFARRASRPAADARRGRRRRVPDPHGVLRQGRAGHGRARHRGGGRHGLRGADVRHRAAGGPQHARGLLALRAVRAPWQAPAATWRAPFSPARAAWARRFPTRATWA